MTSIVAQRMRCLALFTGGLDSQIAVRMMQRQGLDVVGLYVQTPFTPPPDAARAAAERLQLELLAETWQDDYLAIVRRPRFGYAEGLAPCLDCRIGMWQRARAKLESLGASFLISGEVVGQRPSSLRSRDLETMAVHGGVEDLVLRPLSAKLLPPTLPERSGWVDREQLHGWQGRGRKEQLRLATEWNLTDSTRPPAGCLLLQETYTIRLRTLLALLPNPPPWQLKTLSLGRHYTIPEAVHLVVARNSAESDHLKYLWKAANSPAAILLEPGNFRGPTALVCGTTDSSSLQSAAAELLRHSKNAATTQATIQVQGCPWATTLQISPSDIASAAAERAIIWH